MRGGRGGARWKLLERRRKEMWVVTAVVVKVKRWVAVERRSGGG